jgi:hypothetical protein
MQKNLLQIPKWSAAGVDGQTVEAARKSFDGWIEPMLQSIHRQGEGVPRRGALLAQDVAQPQLGRATLDLGEVQPDQSKDAVTETKAAPPICGVAGSCSAVNHLPKSVVR